MFLGLLLVAGTIYGVIAIPLIAILRHKMRRAIRNQTVSSEVKDQWTSEMEAGLTGTQYASFICHIILLAMPVLSLITVGYALLPCLFVLPILAAVTLVLNAFWVYPKKFLFAEEQAFLNKTNSKRLRVQRVLAWITWFFYTLFGIFASATFFDTLASVLNFSY
jgi:hypothetical protein